MAIRLTLDLVDATCADALRFADALRAAGTPPAQPLARGGPPERIEVVLEGPLAPGAPWQFRPGPPPAPYQHPHHTGPHPSAFGMFGSFAGYGTPPRRGCVIQISEDGVTQESHVSPETLDAWRAAITQALEPGPLGDPARSALLELREMLRPRQGFHGGS